MYEWIFCTFFSSRIFGGVRASLIYGMRVVHVNVFRCLVFLRIYINFLIKQTFRPRKWSLIQKVYLFRFVPVYLVAHAAQAQAIFYFDFCAWVRYAESHDVKMNYLQRNEKEWKMPADATINFFLIFPFIYSERRVDVNNFFLASTFSGIDCWMLMSRVFKWKRYIMLVCVRQPKRVSSVLVLTCIQWWIETRMWKMCRWQKKAKDKLWFDSKLNVKLLGNSRETQKWISIALTILFYLQTWERKKKLYRQSEVKPKFRL